jgi:hypothetical protein
VEPPVAVEEAEAVWVARVVEDPAADVGVPAGGLLTDGDIAIPAAELVAAPEAAGGEATATTPVDKEAEAATVEPLGAGAAPTATPHCPIGLFPGSWSNCSPAVVPVPGVPISSGTWLATVQVVPSGLISSVPLTEGHVSVAPSPVLHPLIISPRTLVSQPASWLFVSFENIHGGFWLLTKSACKLYPVGSPFARTKGWLFWPGVQREANAGVFQ